MTRKAKEGKKEASVDLLFDPPEPRRMASLPVAWMASTIVDGAAAKRCQER